MSGNQPPALPPGERPGGGSLPAKLEPLVETARAYARAATSKNTNRAYAADWRDYLRWRARQGLDLKPLADPECVGLYCAAMASGAAQAAGPDRRHDRAPALGARLEFRPEGPALRPQGPPCRDRARRRPAHPWPAARPEGGAPAGACPGDARPPASVELTKPARPGDPPPRLRRRPAPIGNRRPGHEPRGFARRDGLAGIFREGVLLNLRGKTGWREVEIGRGSKDATCPVAALEAWLKFARIARGPLFRAVVGREVGSESLNDRHVARLVKRLAVAAGVRGDLSERDREEKFSGHSLRAGLASSAEIEERYVQKHLGHASAEMTRRYQRRRDRFRVNLTKAAGL